MKDIDPDKMKLNPFAQSFRIPVNRVTDKRYTAKEHLPDYVTYDIETTQSVRIFYTPDEENGDDIIPGTLSTFAALSPIAKNLLFYIMTHLESGRDWIRINRKRYMDTYFVLSINTVKKAETELCVACLINRCELYKDVFWINPKFFYSGNRANKFPHNVDIKIVK